MTPQKESYLFKDKTRPPRLKDMGLPFAGSCRLRSQTTVGGTGILFL